MHACMFEILKGKKMKKMKKKTGDHRQVQHVAGYSRPLPHHWSRGRRYHSPVFYFIFFIFFLFSCFFFHFFHTQHNPAHLWQVSLSPVLTASSFMTLRGILPQMRRFVLCVWWVCVCVSVCDWRDRQREGKSEREGQREGETCACVFFRGL